MSDPFVPVSSKDGLNIPWEMILDGMDASPAVMPSQNRPTFNLKEVVVEQSPSTVRKAQPTGGTSPLSFFVG